MNFKTRKKTRRLERKVARRLQRKTHAVIAKFALQASRPLGRGIWIVKEIPKKTRDLFDLLGVAYPKKYVKN